MESDLSLLEISGEDDSLLQQIPSDDVSNVNKYFSCSPLQIFRSKGFSDPCRASPLDCKKAGESVSKQIRSSPRGKSNKENIIANIPEVPKLGAQPQQMKRRKKGGGYNLRKSLAWDRAFFTEEGVLDPLELSMISGSFDKCNGEALPVIQEEGRNSLAGDADSISDSADLQPLEEHLFKELPASTLNEGNLSKKINEGKKIGSCFFPKRGSSARENVAPGSAVTRKVLSAHDVNKSGSKRGGYSRPLVSSSQKRPANANTTKAVTKESKIPKIPLPKPGPSSLPAVTRGATLGATSLNHNQNARRALPVQKNFGLKDSSNRTRRVNTNAKAGPDCRSLPSRSSVRPSPKDMANSHVQMSSSSNLKTPIATKSSCGLGLIPDPEIPATATQESNAHDTSRNVAVSPTQNAKYIGSNMQSAQLEVRKPSGLRMPSPSLGFFGQPKASLSQCLSERATQPCNISDLPKLDATMSLRPPRPPGKNFKEVSDVIIMGSLSKTCSVSPGGESTSQEDMKLNMHKAEMKVAQKQLHYTVDDAEKQLQERAEPFRIAQISCKGDGESPLNDNNLLSRSRPDEHLENRSDDKMVSDSCEENRVSNGNEMENSNFILQLDSPLRAKCVSEAIVMTDSRDATCHAEQEVHQDGLGSPYGAYEQSEQAELINSSGKAYQKTHTEIQSPQANDSNSLKGNKSSAKSQKSNIKNASMKVQGSTFVQPNEAAGLDINNIRSPEIDAQLQCSDCNLLVENGNTKLSTSAVGNKCLMVGGANEHAGELELQNTCLVDPVYQDCDGMHLDDLCGNELKNFLFLLPLSPAVQAVGDSRRNYPIALQHTEEQPSNIFVSNHGVIAESQSADIISSSDRDTSVKPNNPTSGMHDVDEDCADQSELTKACTSKPDQIFHEENQRLQAGNETLLQETTSFKEVQIHNTGNTTVASPKNRGSSESELDNCQHSSRLNCIDQANEDAAGMYNMTENSQGRDAQVQSLDGNQFVEKLELVPIVPWEAESKISSNDPHQENQRPRSSNGGLFEEATSLEEFWKDGRRCIPYASMKVGDSSGSKVEHSLSSPQLRYKEHGHDDMAKKSYRGDTEVPFLDFDLTAETCQCNQSTSELHNYSATVADKINEESGEHLVKSSKTLCSLREEESFLSGSDDQLSSNQRILQGVGISGSKSKSQIQEETESSQSFNAELRNKFCSVIPCSEDTDASLQLKKSGNNLKQDVLVKPPPDAVPFSDEWLAAMEAAGEDILTLKSGAVQNSPPEKSIPEPSPWSPVRRKNNQEIGPFDCTKYTNNPPSDSH